MKVTHFHSFVVFVTRVALYDFTFCVQLEKFDKARDPPESTVVTDENIPEETSNETEDQVSLCLQALPTAAQLICMCFKQKPAQKEMIMRRRRLVLPPLQVSRRMRPNANYHRKAVEEAEMAVEERKGKGRRSALPGIPEEHSPDGKYSRRIVGNRIGS